MKKQKTIKYQGKDVLILSCGCGVYNGWVLVDFEKRIEKQDKRTTRKSKKIKQKK